MWSEGEIQAREIWTPSIIIDIVILVMRSTKCSWGDFTLYLIWGTGVHIDPEMRQRATTFLLGFMPVSLSTNNLLFID